MMLAPRNIISHSPYDDETREMLLVVYDRIQQTFELDEPTANAVVERILNLAEAGERSPEVIEKAAGPVGEAGS